MDRFAKLFLVLHIHLQFLIKNISKIIKIDNIVNNITKSVIEPFESPSHLINDGIVMCGSFVIHTPTTINEFKLTILYQSLDFSLSCLILFLPPSPEKCNFHINEPKNSFQKYKCVIKNQLVFYRKQFHGKICSFLYHRAMCTLRKNEKFTLTEIFFREINSLVICLVKPLLSRNFCRKSVRLKFHNFHTVM